MPPLFAVSKVIGTATIGLWAGYNIGLAHTVKTSERQVLQDDLTTPREVSKSHADSTLVQVSWATKLSGAAFAFLLGSYAFASRPYRHPYLIYVVCGIPLVAGLQYVGAMELNEQIDRIDDPELEEPSDLTASVYQTVESSDKDAAREHWALALGDKIMLYNTAVSVLSVGLFVLNLVGLTGESVLFV